VAEEIGQLIMAENKFDRLKPFQRCDGFSGADLSALVIEASMFAFKELARGSRTGSGAGFKTGSVARVYLRHFDLAFNKVKPSVSVKDKQHYESMKRRHQVRNV
jgi:ribosome biogenesis ATPase